MICHCFGRAFDLAAVSRSARAAAELVAGLPDYDAYVAHLAASHPDQPALSRSAFFRARQDTRYGARGQLRCC